MVMDLSGLCKKEKKINWELITLVEMDGTNHNIQIDPNNPASGPILLIRDLYRRLADQKNTLIELKAKLKDKEDEL